MALTNQRRLSCLKLRVTFWASVIIAASTIPAPAGEVSRGGVLIRNSASSANREDLVRKLKSITGWPDLDFDQSGFLNVNPNKFRGGSSIARELLKNAIVGEKLIVFEGARSRS